MSVAAAADSKKSYWPKSDFTLLFFLLFFALDVRIFTCSGAFGTDDIVNYGRTVS